MCIARARTRDDIREPLARGVIIFVLILACLLLIVLVLLTSLCYKAMLDISSVAEIYGKGLDHLHSVICSEPRYSMTSFNAQASLRPSFFLLITRIGLIPTSRSTLPLRTPSSPRPYRSDISHSQSYIALHRFTLSLKQDPDSLQRPFLIVETDPQITSASSPSHLGIYILSI